MPLGDHFRKASGYGDELWASDSIFFQPGENYEFFGGEHP